MDQNPAIVIDNGSYELKAGFAGHDAPQYCIPTAVGRPQKYEVQASLYLKEEFYLGKLDLKDLKYLSFSYPIKSGLIVDIFCDMHIIWLNVFKELGISKLKDHPVLLTETSMTDTYIRENMTQIFFEEFNAPKFSVVNQAVLSLYASGRTTGIVLQSGDGVSETVPIYEGYALKHAVLHSDFTGRACTQYQADYMNSLGITYATAYEMKIAREIKQEFCYVALDYQQELLTQGHNSKSYKLPDGRYVELKNQRFQCPELIFNPQLKPTNAPGIHQILKDTIQKCDIDLRRDLYSNIVLSGGNTMFPGYFERLTKELTPLAPENMTVKVDAPPQREVLAWIGGSILSQLSTFQVQYITKEEFKECGAAYLVSRKCF